MTMFGVVSLVVGIFAVIGMFILSVYIVKDLLEDVGDNDLSSAHSTVGGLTLDPHMDEDEPPDVQATRELLLQYTDQYRSLSEAIGLLFPLDTMYGTLDIVKRLIDMSKVCHDHIEYTKKSLENKLKKYNKNS